MSKKFFAKETITAGSYLRTMLGLDNPYSKKVENIIRDGNLVHVHYGKDEVVFIPDDVNRFFKKVKSLYGDQIQGVITASMSYGQVSFIDVTIEFGDNKK